MKVKVVSARSSNYWYADKIGETFEVIDLKDAGYDSIAPGFRFKVIESRSARYIAERDCVFILTYKEKAMNKSDLKTGMRVLTHSQQLAIVLKDIGVLAWIGDGYTNLSSYKEDLTYDGPSEVYSGMSIHVVFEGFTKNSDVLNFNVTGRLLWDRRQKSNEQIQLDKVMNQITELQKQASQLQELINK